MGWLTRAHHPFVPVSPRPNYGPVPAVPAAGGGHPFTPAPLAPESQSRWPCRPFPGPQAVTVPCKVELLWFTSWDRHGCCVYLVLWPVLQMG